MTVIIHSVLTNFMRAVTLKQMARGESFEKRKGGELGTKVNTDRYSKMRANLSKL
jgi:hypothetical protein